MSPLRSLFLLGLLHLLLPNAQGYTVELTKTDNRGNEGANISITVRLEGLITSSVTVEIELLTLSQFLTKPEAPSEYTLSHDPAEPDDFSHDNPLVHTFSPVVSATRQTVDFTIDIVDDTINEKVEQFVVRIVGATTEGTDAYYPEQSDALFATVTILIDPKAPDKTKLRMAAPPDGPITVSEGTTGFGLSLMIEAFPPEQDIEVSVTTMELSPFPAVLGSDYNLATTTVTLTRHVTSYTVSMELIDDGVPEPKSEGVEVMLSVASGDNTVVFQPRSSVTIIIEDNDRLMMGFSPPSLEIKEGHSMMASLFITSPAAVGVSLTGEVAHARGEKTTAANDEIPDSMQFTLSQTNRQFSFEVAIPQNDEIYDGGEREFSLQVEDVTSVSDLYDVPPQFLRVTIKDNDTNVEFGIRDVGPKLVREGESFTMTVGFFDDNLALNDDFVLGYSIKIMSADGADVGKNFVTKDVINGMLSSLVRSQEIKIETETNDEVEDDREFLIVMEHTTDFNPRSLVKMKSGAHVINVTIEDEDINPPIRPRVNTVSLTDTTSGKTFEISWTKNVSGVQPIDSYKVKVTFPAQGRSPPISQETIQNSTSTFLVVSYTQNGVDYSTANITVVVCAANERGETCSDEVFHMGGPQGIGGPEDSGVSGGGIAAIIIVLLLLFCIGIPLLFLLIYLCRIYCWRNYYPPIREKKNEQEFLESRNEYGGYD